MLSYVLVVMSLALPFESVSIIRDDASYVTASLREGRYFYDVPMVRISWRCSDGSSGLVTVPHDQQAVSVALEDVKCLVKY